MRSRYELVSRTCRDRLLQFYFMPKVRYVPLPSLLGAEARDLERPLRMREHDQLVWSHRRVSCQIAI